MGEVFPGGGRSILFYKLCDELFDRAFPPLIRRLDALARALRRGPRRAGLVWLMPQVLLARLAGVRTDRQWERWILRARLKEILSCYECCLFFLQHLRKLHPDTLGMREARRRVGKKANCPRFVKAVLGYVYHGQPIDFQRRGRLHASRSLKWLRKYEK